jgi:hypothetical protein
MSAELFDTLRDTLTRYVVFPAHGADAAALWIAATHCLPAFQFAPRLVLTSPEKRCGKTRLLDIIDGTCHDPLATSNATVAAVFRSLDGDHPPTLLIDEADAIFGSKRTAEQHEDLRALLNAGHERGRPALRCSGPYQTPTQYPTFAMAALAGIGAMPETITDRAVNLTMRRRAVGERVAQFRSRRDGPLLTKLRDRLTAWGAEHHDELTDAEPDMPVTDRAADTWEPLIAVADAAGDHWPTTARAACLALVRAAETADEDRSHGVKLLSDIRQIFGDRGRAFLPSLDLVVALCRVEESPWSDYELTPRKLAVRLQEFGVRSTRDTTGSVRGYRLADFADTFRRYLRQNPSETSDSHVTQGFSSDTFLLSDTSIRQTVSKRQTESADQTPSSDGLTGSDGCSGRSVPFAPPSGPGRCPECGWHIPTQGHNVECSANPQLPLDDGP